jgi:hypothetical protein
MEYFTLGIHRLLVADEGVSANTDNIEPPKANLISQSDIVRYLYERSPEVMLIISATVQGQSVTQF